jgi:hypothetical protein
MSLYLRNLFNERSTRPKPGADNGAKMNGGAHDEAPKFPANSK